MLPSAVRFPSNRIRSSSISGHNPEGISGAKCLLKEFKKWPAFDPGMNIIKLPPCTRHPPREDGPEVVNTVE